MSPWWWWWCWQSPLHPIHGFLIQACCMLQLQCTITATRICSKVFFYIFFQNLCFKMEAYDRQVRQQKTFLLVCNFTFTFICNFSGSSGDWGIVLDWGWPVKPFSDLFMWHDSGTTSCRLTGKRPILRWQHLPDPIGRHISASQPYIDLGQLSSA